jgi:hypothetical protein
MKKLSTAAACRTVCLSLLPIVGDPVEIPRLQEFAHRDLRVGFIALIPCLVIIWPHHAVNIGLRRGVGDIGGFGDDGGGGIRKRGGEVEGETKDVAGAGFQDRHVDNIVARRGFDITARRGRFLFRLKNVEVVSVVFLVLRGAGVENRSESLEGVLTLGVLEDLSVPCLR